MARRNRFRLTMYIIVQCLWCYAVTAEPSAADQARNRCHSDLPGIASMHHDRETEEPCHRDRPEAVMRVISVAKPGKVCS